MALVRVAPTRMCGCRLPASALARVLGRIQPASDKTALRARRSRDLVVRSRQGREHINGAQRFERRGK
jgi:hypothetical protein